MRPRLSPARLEIITRHTHSDSFDALLERLLSKRQTLKDAMAQHGSIENIGQALRAELGRDPQQEYYISQEGNSKF